MIITNTSSSNIINIIDNNNTHRKQVAHLGRVEDCTTPHNTDVTTANQEHR